MDLKEHLKSESAAFAERLASLLDEQVNAVRADLERESARAAALEADLDNVIAAHRDVEQDRSRAAQDVARLEQDAHRLDDELQRTRELLERARAEAGRLHESLEAETAQIALAREALDTAHARIERLELEAAASADAMTARCEALQSQVSDLTGALSRAQADADALRQQHAESEAARTENEAALAASEAARAAAVAALATSQALAAQTAHVLEESVAAVDALSQALTVDALLQELTARAALNAPRVVVFRAKGNHLEGERGIGVDSAVDVTKLMIPTGVDSLLARAVSTGSLVRATREQLAAVPPPLGGTAAAALAIPIVLHDQLIAVLYADSPEDISEARATATLLLTRHAAAALSRLARELKTLDELREYAVMLVDEVAQIYNADVEAGCSEPERLRRVRGSIDYARELYAHRAAIEGPSAATLFEKHLAAVREQDSLFARALAILDEHESHRTAS